MYNYWVHTEECVLEDRMELNNYLQHTYSNNMAPLRWQTQQLGPGYQGVWEATVLSTYVALYLDSLLTRVTK
jgi:hypothetical protein